MPLGPHSSANKIIHRRNQHKSRKGWRKNVTKRWWLGRSSRVSRFIYHTDDYKKSVAWLYIMLLIFTSAETTISLVRFSFVNIEQSFPGEILLGENRRYGKCIIDWMNDEPFYYLTSKGDCSYHRREISKYWWHLLDVLGTRSPPSCGSHGRSIDLSAVPWFCKCSCCF